MALSSLPAGAVAFGVFATLLPAAHVAAQSPDSLTIRASAEELLVFSDRLIATGQQAEAILILRTLLRDPSRNIRNEARYRWAKLLKTTGSGRAAAEMFRAIIDEDPNVTPVRLELAQLLDGLGDKEGAWRELRAAQAAGLPPDVARIVDRYSDGLRAARPIGASFEVAIAPDSNIGRSTRYDRLSTVIGDFEIDEDSQAKSGLGLSVRGEAFRRVPWGGSGHSVSARLGGFANLYRRSRFNEIAVDLAAGPEFEFGPVRFNLELGVTQRWYGQSPYLRAARMAGVSTIPIGRRSRLWLKGTAHMVDQRTNDLQDGKVFSTTATLEHALTTTTGLSVSAGVDRSALRDPGYSSKSWHAGILVWREVGRATLTAELETGRLRADERLWLFPEKRNDKSLRFSIGSTFRKFAFAGYAPITRLIVERNRSTVEFYDYRRVRTEIGLVRSF